MLAPHPLAAVAQHLVRERSQPRQARALRPRRRWWSARRQPEAVPAVAPIDVPAAAEPLEVFEAPPGLALPPVLAVVPRQRTSSERLEEQTARRSA
jgi:hypothetical protein